VRKPSGGHTWVAGGLLAAAIVAAGGGVLAGRQPPAVRTLTLPPETAIYAQRDMPGYNLVVRNCLGCHSAQYVSTQPPTSPRTYWEATVRKMKSPFGAPFPDEDIAAMVDYLVRTYGAERQTP
jgi:cytochrome c5